jgi:hypothetical protein
VLVWRRRLFGRWVRSALSTPDGGPRAQDRLGPCRGPIHSGLGLDYAYGVPYNRTARAELVKTLAFFRVESAWRRMGNRPEESAVDRSSEPPCFVAISSGEYLSEAADQAQMRMDVSLQAVDSTITVR